MSIKYASVVIELEDGRVVQRPLTIEERRFILAILADEEILKVTTCEGIEFSKGKLTKPVDLKREVS